MATGEREQQQCHGAATSSSPYAQRDDEPAIEAIGDLSAGQQQHDERQELREPDVAPDTQLAGVSSHIWKPSTTSIICQASVAAKRPNA